MNKNIMKNDSIYEEIISHIYIYIYIYNQLQFLKILICVLDSILKSTLCQKVSI